MHTILGCHGVAQYIQTDGTSELCSKTVFAEWGCCVVCDELLWLAMEFIQWQINCNQSRKQTCTSCVQHIRTHTRLAHTHASTHTHTHKLMYKGYTIIAHLFAGQIFCKMSKRNGWVYYSWPFINRSCWLQNYILKTLPGKILWRVAKVGQSEGLQLWWLDSYMRRWNSMNKTTSQGIPPVVMTTQQHIGVTHQEDIDCPLKIKA